MVLERLGDSLKASLRKITGSSFVDEKAINELVKDIQRALLQSDVNVSLVFAVTKRMKDRALSEKPPKGLGMREHVVRIVHDELVAFLGGDKTTIELTKKPFVIMLVGLFGNGKTTTAGKLARYYKKRNLKVVLLSTDTWRPAASDQLRMLGEQVGVPAFGDKTQKDPVKIIEKFRPEFKDADVVIVDTAGRDALSDELVEELTRITSAVKADETLLVMNADVGQSARAQAQMFHDTCKVTGVIITKLEGTAKGGGALSACAVTGAPVKFIGVGEKIDDLEQFNPTGFVGRLLGMGDIEMLLEKAQEAFAGTDTEAVAYRMLKGDFTLVDLYEQMQAMRKMGSLSKLMQMIPGMGNANIPKEALDVQEGKLDAWKHVMNSMTRRELESPEEVLNPSRIDRIALGSGQSVEDVRALIKQYKQSKKLVKLMKGMDGGSEKDMQKMMVQMQKKMGRKKLRF